MPGRVVVIQIKNKNMSKDPAFPFYAQDFLTGVMHLTMEERGIYITLLSYQWEHKSIPKKRLGFIVGLTWENLCNELKVKFIDKGETIINHRLEEERLKRENFKKKQSDNGKKGGRGNKSKKPNKSQKKPLEDESDKEGEEVNEVEIYPSFTDFWDLYDKKIGKKENVKKKWEKLPQKTKETIIEYIPFYINSQPDKKYRKNPETFLNNEAWKDEIINNQSDGQQDNQKGGASPEYRRKTAERLGIT